MVRNWYRNVHTGRLGYVHHIADNGRIALFNAAGVVAVVTVSMLCKHWERVQ